MYTFLELFLSPIGPPIVLLLGAIVQIVCGRWVRRPLWLTGLALAFVATAFLLLLNLRLQPVVPVYSQPWQPLLHSGANLYWVGDGWNWYISSLILLLGGLGILLALNNEEVARGRHIHGILAVNLAVIAASLLFVDSGNLLTVILTWVMVDILALVRSATRPDQVFDSSPREESYTRGLSLIGAMLLLMGLLPAGPTGPSQEFVNGKLPFETIYLMAIASAIRAGIYPFHLWLLPNKSEPPKADRLPVSEHLLEHLVPALSGLWLMGWTFSLGAEFISLRFGVLAILLLALFGSAIAAWSAKNAVEHATLVLITSAGLAALTGALAYAVGPSAMIWPTTAFALGGGLWLVGQQVWQGWGWQIPVSVGALTLAGVPFTPGFLTQPAVARLLMRDLPALTQSPFAFPASNTSVLATLLTPHIIAFLLSLLLFALYIAAQTVQVAALLRSFEEGEQEVAPHFPMGSMIRLLIASIALGLPLAVAGVLPTIVASVASIPDAIPPTLGNPPSVVAELPVWITLGLPLLAGIGLVWLRPKGLALLGDWPSRINRVARLDWLFSFTWWSANRASEVWWNALRVVEGAGYMGWLLVILLMGYLLTH
ncbi:MAG: hypothetical protein U0350_34135 [Caldilineaceae bacterium]